MYKVEGCIHGFYIEHISIQSSISTSIAPVFSVYTWPNSDLIAENRGTNCSHTCQADDGGQGQGCNMPCLQPKQRWDMDGRVNLNGSDTVRETLKKKHPPGMPIVPSAIIPPEEPAKEASFCNL